jgi:SAM-dependent methyltransferase
VDYDQTNMPAAYDAGRAYSPAVLALWLVRYARAAGELLPLPDACVDMVFISMVFHHFDDPAQAVRECRRVLRRDGTVCLRGTADRVGETPYLPFFAGSGAILKTAFHSQAAIEAIFIDAGFQLVGHELIRHEVAGNWKAYADRLAFRADSILVQLSDQEFDGGLAALRRHAVTAPSDEPVTELVDFFVFRSG